MSDPKSNGSDGGKGDCNKEAAVAKTAGFLVFAGIAMSVIKTLIPKSNNNNNRSKCCGSPPPTTTIQTQQYQESKLTSREKSSSLPRTTMEIEKGDAQTTIEIEKRDTLWAISRKYGVSIVSIKEANGLTGDTIYAGKKLVIP